MIIKLEVQNFRSIKEAHLVLPKFLAIIGRNSSGKTNLISAIQFTTSLASSGQNINKALKASNIFFAELFNCDLLNQNTKIKITAKIDGNFYCLEYAIGSKDIGVENDNQLAVVAERLVKFDSDAKEHQIYRRLDNGIIITLPSGEEGIVPFKVSHDQLVLSAYSAPEVKLVAEAIAGYSIVSFPKQEATWKVISDNVPDLNSVDGVVVALFKKNHGLFDEATRVIKSLIPDFKKPEVQNLNELLKKADQSDQSVKESPAYVVSWRENYSKGVFSANTLSGGNLRTIFTIFSLFNLPANSTMVLEEIENGIHFERIERLVDQLRTQGANRNIQIIFSTHSDRILGQIHGREAIYVSKDVNNGSIYRMISETQEFATIKEELVGKEPTVEEIIKMGLLPE